MRRPRTEDTEALVESGEKRVGPARDDAARMGQVRGSWYLQNHRSALHHPADYLELDGPTVIHQHGDIRPPVHALGKPRHHFLMA